jgi:predicted RNase H-like HicB family nuclease
MKNNDFNTLSHTRVIQEMNDESGHYFYGKILELDGCQSTGDTLEELHKNLSEAIELYLEVKDELQ